MDELEATLMRNAFDALNGNWPARVRIVGEPDDLDDDFDEESDMDDLDEDDEELDEDEDDA